MKVKLLLLLLLGLGTNVKAQVKLSHTINTFCKNTFFVEVGGTAGLGSINYDRMLHEIVSLRVGAGIYPQIIEINRTTYSSSKVVFPLELNFISSGSSNHHFEMGLGIYKAFAFDANYYGNSYYIMSIVEKATINYCGRIGYRYQRKQGGFFAKAAFTPIFYKELIANTGRQVNLWGGLSLGYTLPFGKTR